MNRNNLIYLYSIFFQYEISRKYAEYCTRENKKENGKFTY